MARDPAWPSPPCLIVTPKASRAAAEDGAPLGAPSRLSHLVAGPMGERLLSLAAVIVHEQVERGRRGLVLCGAASGAGVSLVCASLGLALAQSGVNVLVVDANLRRPAMQDIFPPMGPVEAGLLQYLSGDVQDPAELTYEPVAPNLSVLYAGGVGEGAAELFDAERFETIMRHCQRSATLTLIDAPPANRCAETRRIAAVAGYAAIVARRDVSLSEDIAALALDLATSRVEVIGTILNEG